MGLFIRCPTDEAILLAGFTDAVGVFRYVTESSDLPGIRIRPQSGLALHDQFMVGLNAFLQSKCLPRDLNLKLMLHPAFEDTIEIPGDAPVTLYLGQVVWDLDSPNNWPTLAELLRGMPKTRTRLAYMRAVQALAGGIKDDLQALETDKLPF